MAKAKKLKSGKWNIQPYCDGIRVSFTADTKAQAELLAAQWKNERRMRSASDVPLSVAIKNYSGKSEQALSPTTINGYIKIRERLEQYDISRKKISRITAADLQALVNELSRRYAPKTVKNTYGLVTASLRFYGVVTPTTIHLPPATVKSYELPSDDDLRQILRLCDDKMTVAVYLAAFCGLRRSEICALTSDDIDHDNKCVRIHSALVADKNGNLVVKGTKTTSSTRIVMLPDFVYEKIKDIDGRICPMTPKAISCQWEKRRKKIGSATRFHDLRHYSASVMHGLNIPDQYVQGRHGWRSDYALKQIYRNEIDEFARKMNARVNDYFDERFGDIANEIADNPRKTP